MSKWLKKPYQRIVSNRLVGYGHRKITVKYRGEQYSAITTSMDITDKYSSEERGWKTAGNQLYYYVLMKNNLI